MRILLSAGEASGDLQGGALLTAICELRPDVEAYAVGGDRLQTAGAQLIADTSSMGAIGIFEAVKLLPRFLAGLAKLKRALVRLQPDLLVLIDFGAFNMRIVDFARERGIPTLYYFPPGSWRRRLSDKRKGRWLGDAIVSPFPWNAKDLREAGHNAHFFGHPLLDIIGDIGDRHECRRAIGIEGEGLVVGLLPGSRIAELTYLWPEMAHAADSIHRAIAGVRFVVPLAANLPERASREVRDWRGEADVRVISGQAHDVMAASDLIVTAAGTATLEAAVIGCPLVVVYRGNRLSYWQYLLHRKNIPFIAAPNIIAEKEICPELLQMEANGEKIASMAIEMLSDPGKRASMRAELVKVREILGQPGAIRRSAQLALSLVERRSVQ